MTDKDATVRAYREGDETEINRLFNEVFSEARSLPEWQWKFKENPVGVLMIAVAEAGGMIVGHYASMPFHFQYLDRVIKVAVPVDNFVHPAYRGRLSILKSIYEHQARLWDHVAGFGFPREAYAVVGRRILKYRPLTKMPVLFRRLNVYLAAKNYMPWLGDNLLAIIRHASNVAFTALVRMRSVSSPRDIRIRVAEGFDTRFDELWERIRHSQRIMCVRDRRFLEWRFRRPGCSYRIVVAEKNGRLSGYAVTGLKREAGVAGGYIADLITDGSPGVAAALVKRALLELLAQRADYATCWMLPDKPDYRALLQLGFATKEQAFPPVNLVFQCFDAQAVDLNILQDPASWFLTMADSDVF